MAKNSVTDWDETAGNNTDISGIDIDEGCAPSGMNNAIRAAMAQIKAFFKSTAFRLRDGTDQTKLLAFDLSGISAGTTRSLAAPNASGTIAITSRAVMASEVQSFTDSQKGQARANIGGGLLAGMRNPIINGDARIRTRYDGIAFSGTKYAFDRWEVATSGGTVTPNITDFVPGAEIQGSKAYFYLGRASGGNTTFFIQKMDVDWLRYFSGGKVTVTYWEAIDAGKTVTVRLDQQFGSGGSATVNTAVETVIGTGSWTKHSVVVDLPTITGKTLGSNPRLDLVFRWDGADGSGAIRFTRISVVKGDATAEDDPSGFRDMQQEVALSRRFARIIQFRAVMTATAASQYVANTTDISDMRGTPTITTVGTDTVTNTGSVTVGVVSSNGAMSVRADAQSAASGTAGFIATRLLDAEI